MITRAWSHTDWPKPAMKSASMRRQQMPPIRRSLQNFAYIVSPITSAAAA